MRVHHVAEAGIKEYEPYSGSACLIFIPPYSFEADAVPFPEPEPPMMRLKRSYKAEAMSEESRWEKLFTSDMAEAFISNDWSFASQTEGDATLALPTDQFILA